MEYQQVPAATSFPRKVAYGYGHSHSHSRSFSGKTIYDGVFAVRASKKTSVVEDYSEIFGGSGSSIPVLDVPELNEGKLRVDVGSSKLDYAKVFGGFEEFDFAQSHEELLANPKKRETSSFEEARDHTGTGFLSEVSSSKVTVDSPVSADSAHEASQRPVDSVKPLKMSYDKTNHGNKNGTNAAAHTARLHAVPGNTRISDGVSPLQMAKGNQAVSVAKNNECGPGLTEGKHFKNAKAELTSCPDDVSKTSRNGIEIQKKSCQTGCNLNDRIRDTYEIGLGTNHSKMSQSSSLPCELDKNKDSGRSVVSKLRAYKSYSAEDTAGIYSSPYSDEEVDANSAAAASAAAVKKAIEEAQARIKIAKEIMERKKEGLQNRVKPSFNDGLKTQHRGEGKITGKASKSRKKKAQDIFEKVDTKQIVSGIGDPDRKKAGKLALEDRGWAKLSFATEAQSKTLGKNFQSTQGDHRLEEVGTHEAVEQGEYNKKMQFVKEYEWKEKNVASEKVEEYIKNMKAIEDAVILEEVEGKHNAVEGAGDSPDCPHKLKSADEVLDWEEIEKKSRVAHQREEIEKKFQVSFESEQCERKLEEIQEAREDEGKPETQGLADNENVRILQDAEEGTEKDEKQKELLEQKQNNTRSESVYKRNDTEMRFDESASEKEFGKSHHKAYDVVDFWEEHEEAGKLKENEELKEFYSDGNIERRSTEDQELETIEVRVDNFHENEENDYGLEIDGGLGRIENLIQAKDNFTILKESYLMGEFENRDQETCEWIETGKIQAEIGQEAEDERNEAIKGTPRSCRNDTDAYTDACMQDEDETLEACNHEGNSECLELSPEVLECGGKGVLVDVTETSSICKLIREELIGVEVVNDQEEKKVIETVGLGQDATELNEIKERVEDTTDCPAFEKNEMNLGTSDMDFEQHEEEYEMVCNMGKHVEELACEYKENNGDSKESKSTDKQEQDENNPISFEERCVDNGMEAARLPGMFEREGETMESTDNIETSQSTEDTEENQFETLTKVEVEAKDALQKEVKLETEHVNKIDEAKDRAREREKERIVVERAIREARERAFAEARERAALDRANGGGHRRVTAEARGRSEKTSTEVNDKSSAEKASMEAKLKAERAAVERATAEARERALERALSEKAAFEARNQAEKFSRDNGMKQRFPSFDPLYKGSAPSKSSKFPNSSNHSVPPSTERFDGANVESAERCKARLERHQRTTERAAKALAEKNMRDLLVQKEQAEKNRLAETLDADVKRWSSGKEGNLRALLSTLQYILGSDSGWQPIPLTDLITTGAVKKAYRKATLCVHPDKLQQRGASIQQKYTCEKVFDLLKEAWNKFSVEER